MLYLEEIATRIRAEIPRHQLPDGETDGLFFGYAALALSSGERVTASEVHDAWSVWMSQKDRRHTALVPYDKLDEQTQAADEPYLAAIRSVARQLDTAGVRVDNALLPNGLPNDEAAQTRLFELYKIMVDSSEALVGRRQGINTFFLTVNGAMITAIGLFVRAGGGTDLKSFGIAIIALAGVVLSIAWRSLLLSFGQLNKGKFAIINRLERLLPAAIYAAEWEALERGEDPKTYRTFTSREIWAPNVLIVIYLITIVVCILVITGALGIN